MNKYMNTPNYSFEKSRGWFYESAANNANITANKSESSFAPQGIDETIDTSFDSHFKKLADTFYERCKIDIKRDYLKMLSDPAFMETYKVELMKPVIAGFRQASPGDPHVESVIKNVNTFWDTKVKLFNESATMTTFLPIATLEFPVLVKQFFQTILKDIIEVEAVKTPMISRHICTRYLVDNQTGQEYEYPKCMFNGQWQNIWKAAKGIEIFHRVDLPQHQYDLIERINAAHEAAGDGVVIDRATARLTFQLMIPKVIIQTGNQTTTQQQAVDDQGHQRHVHGHDLLRSHEPAAQLAGGGGVVIGVIFQGYVSNEANLRSVSVREERSILRFTIEDGPRWNMPFSIEEIEDAAALLDLNYYNRMVDEIVRTQEQIETMTVIKFLNDQFDKFNGVVTDIYKLESVAMDYQVDLQPPVGFAGDPFKYISSVIQFRLKAIFHDLTDLLKLDNLSFIIVGNPMAVQPICEFVNWKCMQGTSIGGITVNGSYGFATDMGANVRVVSSNLYDPYTTEDVVQNAGEANEKSQKELVLHIYGYPTSPDHIS